MSVARFMDIDVSSLTHVLCQNYELTVECDTDDDQSQYLATVVMETMGQYSLESNDDLDPVSIEVDGIHFLVKYRKLS